MHDFGSRLRCLPQTIAPEGGACAHWGIYAL